MKDQPSDDEAVQTSTAPWIEETCDRFEAAIKDGRPVRIEDLLDDRAGAERESLLRELILVELFHHRSRAEGCGLADYLKRFPEIDHDWLAAAVAADSLPPKPQRALLTPSVGGEGTISLATSASEIKDVSNGACDFLGPPQNPGELGRLGSYHVLKVLGVGGMGMVFLAHDPQLERPVALKVMRPDVAASPSARERFLREARAAAAIKHDHIVTIYQVSEDRGTPFLAMELLEGEPLDERLRREGKLSLRELLRIGREMAEGLAAAHKRGLIHRDVKPGNVWLEGDGGRVKILDFGLVRAAAAGAERHEASAAADAPTPSAGALTQLGAVMGTPAFMAPEQVNGSLIDARCDLFSLGCVLYRMATGELPFKGDNTASTLLAVVHEAPRPPQEINPELPPALSDLVMKLLTKKREDRPTSAQAVVESLRTCEREQVVAMPPRSGRWYGFAAAAILLIGVLALGCYLFGPAVVRYISDEGELVVEIDDPQVEAVIDQAGLSLRDKARDRIYQLKPGQKTSDLPTGDYEIEVTETGGDVHLFTKEFTITRGGKTTVTATLVSSVGKDKVGQVRVFEGHEGVVRCVAFSHDGRTLLSGGGGEYDGHDLHPGQDNCLRLWNASSGQAIRRIEVPAAAVNAVAYSSDDKRALCGTEDGTITLWDLETGKELQRFMGHKWIVTSVAFISDGRKALSSSMDRTMRLWDVGSGKEVGQLDTSATQVFSAGLSADARFAVSGHHDDALRLWDVPGAKMLRRIPASQPGWATPVAIDPVGRFALYGVFNMIPQDHHAIHMIDLRSGKEVRTLKGPVSNVTAIAFCPGGERALSASFDGTVRLWDVAAGHELCALEGHAGRITGVAFSPDGCFAASGGVDKTVRLWRLPEPPLPAKTDAIPGDQGGLTVDSSVPDAQVVVKQSGKVVRTIYTLFDSVIGLKPGEYQIELAANHENLNVRPEKFTLAAGGRQVVRVRWNPLWNKAVDPGRTAAADQALKALLAREADPNANQDQLRLDVLAFRQNYSGMPQIQGAAQLLKRLPSPFDRLRREDVPEEEIAAAGNGDPKQAPAGLVAVLGDNRLKHWDSALVVKFSPDGKLLATAGKDGLILLWSLPSRRLVRTLLGHKSWVLSVAFSPDGLKLASASHDGTAKLWDAATGKELRTLAGHHDILWSAAFSLDGKTLATTSRDRTIKLWDVASGVELKTLSGHTADVGCAAFHPDGRTLVSGSRDGSILEWDLTTGRRTRILADGQGGEVNTVTFSRDGKWMATSNFTGVVKLWAMPAGTLVHEMPGHEGPARCVVFSADQKRIASAGYDRTVRLWDVETGRELHKLIGHKEEVHCVDFAPEGSLLASASFDRTVRLWDATTGKEAFPSPGFQGAVGSVAVSPDGQLIASASDDHTVRLWETTTAKETRILTEHKKSFWPVAFSADGLRLASAGEDGVVKIWDVARGRELVSWPAHQNWVSTLAFSPDGKILASGSWDRTTALWDAATGRKQDAPFKPQQAVYGAAFSPDGRVVASAGDDGVVRLWDAAARKMRSLTVDHSVTSLAFSADGRFLAAGGAGAATLWQTATGELRTFHVSGQARLALAVSPDGETLAATADGAIHFWDTATGNPKETLYVGPHAKIVPEIAYHPDGWAFSQLAFSPDGRYLITANRNDTLYIIRLAERPIKTPKR